jgi:broad specificity phosphatase PhoE
VLYLVRHAEVVLRGDVPSTEWRLSPAGEQQARDLARSPAWSELALIASSPEAKAIATAEPIAEAAGLELRLEPGLHEVDRGENHIVTREEYDAAVAAHFSGNGDAGWETGESARRRVGDCIDRLTAEVDGPVCVISHGLVLSHYLAHLRGLPGPDFDEWRAIELPAVAIVDEGKLVQPFASLLEFLELA